MIFLSIFLSEWIFQNESDDGSCELVINNISRFDAGNYRCVAENIYGSARTINEVVVQSMQVTV